MQLHNKKLQKQEREKGGKKRHTRKLSEKFGEAGSSEWRRIRVSGNSHGVREY